MKKIILTSAAALIIALTAFIAYGSNTQKHETVNAAEKQECKNGCNGKKSDMSAYAGNKECNKACDTESDPKCKTENESCKKSCNK